MVHREESAQVMVGVDTGGTFTDFAARDSSGRWQRLKILSTPHDPSKAILEGLKRLGLLPVNQNIEIVHGTTVGTNAFLERKGARTVLITTEGFEDVLFIGRQARPSLYDLTVQKPPPIIPRSNIFGVRERVGYDGRVITPLGEEWLSAALDFCRKIDPESIAVCFLHSYANSSHEEQMAKYLMAALDIPVTCSSKVMPEFREYERLSTTLINAYLNPVVGNYTAKLSKALEGASLYVQQSNGGCMPAESTGSRAVTTLLSGPAGGVQAAYSHARSMGLDKIITFDMGGTSTDVSLCSGGLTYTRDYRIDGYPVGLPIIDIHTVGAGGGSIAWIDRGGLIQVGPQSAGADPGPICYGRGDKITVTDANLFLGRLRAESFLAGNMKLHEDKLEPAFKQFGESLGLDPVETALGVIRLVNNSMVQAIRAVSVERGFDPSDFTLFCYGGAAGLHACEVAESLKIAQVIVPERAGVFSAQGMSEADLVFEGSEAFVLSHAETRENEIQEEVQVLTERLAFDVQNHALGYDMGSFEVESFVDCRYAGQSFELTVPWNSSWKENFEALHKRLYGYVFDDRSLEVTAVRSRVVLKRNGTALSSDEMPCIPNVNDLEFLDPSSCSFSEVDFNEGKRETLMIQRKHIAQDTRVDGPAVILDDFTTVLVPPGWAAGKSAGNLLLQRI